MKKHENTNKLTSFARRLQGFEHAERTRPICFGHIVTDTAKMLAFSVLSKLEKTGSHVEIIRQLRIDVATGTGDGFELVSCGCVAILEEIEKAHGRHGETLPANWFELPYTVETLDKRVVINSEKSAKMKQIEIAPITQVYRAIRDGVASNRSVQAASLKYCYIADENTDGLYYRIDRDNTVIDDDGTAKNAMVHNMNELVASLNLTDTQSQVLKLRLKGYGIQAIASYFGRSKQAVAKTLKQIQAKTLAVVGTSGAEFALSETIADVFRPDGVSSVSLFGTSGYADVIRTDTKSGEIIRKQFATVPHIKTIDIPSVYFKASDRVELVRIRKQKADETRKRLAEMTDRARAAYIEFIGRVETAKRKESEYHEIFRKFSEVEETAYELDRIMIDY